MITLHDYWRSSASYRVRIALGLAGLKWQTHSVNLLEQEHLRPDHLALNPQGLVPALELDGQTFTQSLAIIEYLNETRDLGLLPDDPAERAKVRALSYVIAMEIHPVCNLSVAQYVSQHSDGKIGIEQWMQQFISKGLKAYEAQLVEGAYSYQDGISLADICLMPQVYNAKRWKVDLSPLPKIRCIVQNLDTHPAFIAAHPDKTVQS